MKDGQPFSSTHGPDGCMALLLGLGSWGCEQVSDQRGVAINAQRLELADCALGEIETINAFDNPRFVKNSVGLNFDSIGRQHGAESIVLSRLKKTPNHLFVGDGIRGRGSLCR